MKDYVRVAPLAELPPGSSMSIKVNGVDIAIFNFDNTLYAIDALCPHKGGLLSQGQVENCEIICPKHGWKFSLRTGCETTRPPNFVSTFEVRIGDEEIFIAASIDFDPAKNSSRLVIDPLLKPSEKGKE
jgi:3-phenylpropionate/trans-cinnamate dioxygenase ferredoxin subunit